MFPPGVKKTLEAGLQWTRYQICTVVKQYVQAIQIHNPFVHLNRLLSVHVQHIVLHGWLWHVNRTGAESHVSEGSAAAWRDAVKCYKIPAKVSAAAVVKGSFRSFAS